MPVAPQNSRSYIYVNASAFAYEKARIKMVGGGGRDIQLAVEATYAGL